MPGERREFKGYNGKNRLSPKRGKAEALIWVKIKKCATVLAVSVTLTVFSTTALAADIPKELVPMGNAVGISIRTNGAMVSELSSTETENGVVSPAKDAGILPGDIITMVGEKAVTDAKSLTEALTVYGVKEVPVRVEREGKEIQFSVEPCNIGGSSFIGVWVRDAMTGIGTVTFYDPKTDVFGALGHGVNDMDTGVIIPVRDGVIMPANISGITPGQAGTPGQLGGLFSMENTAGIISDNSDVGIFGEIYHDTLENMGDIIPVGIKSDIKVGDATILSTTEGETVREYDVEITRVYTESGDGRSMMIKVTDDDLISVTGGIVQGMSGSPIIQNGKLIGAVTHVMISDPTRGYGIAIGDMLEQAYAEVDTAA